MSKKTLLNEATIRRFAKLAQIPAMKLEETQAIDEEELEEGMYGRDDKEEDLEETITTEETLEETEELEEEADMDMGEEPEMDEPEMGEPEMDMGEEPEMGEMDAEVKIEAGDLESLEAARDLLNQILAAGPGGEDDAPEMDMEMDMGDEDPEPEPEMDMDDEPAPMMEIDDEKLEEMINRVTERVSKRIVKEALLRRVKKD